MKRYLIFILIFCSCATKKHITEHPAQGSRYNPLIICDRPLKALALQCVGDHITGADSGGYYEVVDEPNGSNISIDSTTGCFDDEDMICDGNDGLYVFRYIVDNPGCDNCQDTTLVYFLKCCIELNGNCNE